MESQHSLCNPNISLKTDRLLSRHEAAALLGVKEGTLAIWHTTGRYPLTVIKVGRLVKYRLSDIERFLEKRIITHETQSL